MSISVLIIGHNEEKYIAECIESVLNQTTKADEVVFLNHNSTDRSGEIARRYPITVIDYEGPRGPAYARMKGIESVSGDIILCTDADSVLASNWVQIMTEVLEKPNIAVVGSWIKMRGNLYARLASWRWYITCVTHGKQATNYVWGASFGFIGRHKELVLKVIAACIPLSEKLRISPVPEDFWIALYLYTQGDAEVTNKTHVTAYAKEANSFEAFMRGIRLSRNASVIKGFIKEHGLPALS